MFNGLDMNMSTLPLLSNAVTRSICPENPRGEKGMGGTWELDPGDTAHPARELGKKWKIRPCVRIRSKEVFEMADITGPGAVRHIWMTPTGTWRYLILRIYWDDQETPSVECPVGDFFCAGWNQYTQINSLAVCVNPGSAFNCYWTMPFQRRCRMTLENLAEDDVTVFYQIDYMLTEVPEDCGYFHAQFRRVNPLPYKQDYTILDGVQGKGHFAGCYMAWGVHNNNWWGEGEIKFFLDGDGEYPTICGTGTEDYFCGSYNFEDPFTHARYTPFSTPYTGFHEIHTDSQYLVQKRFGMYRFHIVDPIRFEKDLKVTIQALGWRDKGRYLPLQDDIASVAFWYQTIPAAAFPPLPDKDSLEII